MKLLTDTLQETRHAASQSVSSENSPRVGTLSDGHKPPAPVQAEVHKLVLFDLDHTLLPIDSDYAWGEFTTARGWTDPIEFKRKNEAFYAQYQAGVLDVHQYVRFATEALCRQGAANSIALREEFMTAVIHKNIHPQALELVSQHQKKGAQVLIITATNEFVTRPIADALGVTELIAVELERDAAPHGAAWFTGAIRGVPSFREGKVTRMTQWLHARGLDWGQVHTTFYSDSINDLSLLEKVTVPIATNPDARLRAMAQERQWRILDLFA